MSSTARLLQYRCRACGTIYPTWVQPCKTCADTNQQGGGFNTLEPYKAPIPTTHGHVEAIPLGARAQPGIAVGQSLPVGGQFAGGMVPSTQSARLVAIGGVPTGQGGRPHGEARLISSRGNPILQPNGNGAPQVQPPPPVPGAQPGTSPMGMVPPPPPPPPPVRMALESTEAAGEEEPRLPTGHSMLDRFLGGGFVLGSTILLSGPPGSGKSTVMLQACAGVSRTNRQKCLVATSEESRKQVMQRVNRIGCKAPGLYVAAVSDLNDLWTAVEEIDPLVLVIDSLQELRGFDEENGGPKGEQAMLKATARAFRDWSKAFGKVAVFLSQVNKDGTFNGARAIEHLVAAHFAFEQTESETQWLLRTYKNRYGQNKRAVTTITKAHGVVEIPDHFACGLEVKADGMFCKDCEKPLTVLEAGAVADFHKLMTAEAASES